MKNRITIEKATSIFIILLVVMVIFLLIIWISHPSLITGSRPEVNALMRMSLEEDSVPALLIDDIFLGELQEGELEIGVFIGESSSRLTQRFKKNLEEILLHNNDMLFFYIDVDSENIENPDFQTLMDGLGILGLPALVLFEGEFGAFYRYYFEGYETCSIIKWIREVDDLTGRERENGISWWENQLCSED